MNTQLIKGQQGDVNICNYYPESGELLDSLPEGAKKLSGKVVAGTNHKHYVEDAEVYEHEGKLYIVPLNDDARVLHENSESNQHYPQPIGDQPLWLVVGTKEKDPYQGVRYVAD